MRTLATPRLRLEPLTRHHAPELFEALASPALYAMMDEKPPASLEAVVERYTRLESRRSADGREAWLNWVVREMDSAAAIGYVQATLQEDGTTFIGYVIAPAAQRRGFAREATSAMLEELRAAYGAKRFRASADARNASSIALLRALGFTNDGADAGDLLFSL